MTSATHSAVVCAYRRTPFTPAHKGALAKIRPDDLLAALIDGLLATLPLSPEAVDDLLIGCAFPEGEQGMNLARMAGFLSVLPNSVPGQTINRWCGSSMQAIHAAVGAIAAGAGSLFLAGGVESMTRIPMGGYNPLPNPALYQRHPQAYMSMGLTAEELAKRYHIPREQQETFALRSHQKAALAAQSGHLQNEILPVFGVTADGCVRPDTSPEALATLKPAFDANGTVTAGTSSPLTDGASLTLIASEAAAKQHRLPILARIRSMAVTGCDPDIMGIGPVAASQLALQRAGLTLKDMAVVELNEAFAAQSLAVIQELGLNDATLNADGGAIALGHPLGASGARIVGKAAQRLARGEGRYALATLCIGGGQGMATVLETVG